MGDDLQDLAAFDEVGFFTTPNAIDLVKDRADYVSKRFGGDGAVREICDLIIRNKGSSPVKYLNIMLIKYEKAFLNI